LAPAIHAAAGARFLRLAEPRVVAAAPQLLILQAIEQPFLAVVGRVALFFDPVVSRVLALTRELPSSQGIVIEQELVLEQPEIGRLPLVPLSQEVACHVECCWLQARTLATPARA
jgi:hypothetical protein